MKNRLIKILENIAIISIFCSHFVYAQTPASEVTSSLAYSFEPQYTDDAGTELAVTVVDFADDEPPTRVQLIQPNGGIHISIPRPTFSWHESYDNKQIVSYTFHLEGQPRDTTEPKDYYKFSVSFPPEGAETDRYRVWYENGKYYLEIKFDLAEGIYKWWVDVSDGVNTVVSETWNFDYSHLDACDANSALKDVKLIHPSSVVGSRKPMIILEYPAGLQLSSLDLYVDGQLLFNGVSIQDQNQDAYSVRVVDNRIIFQPNQDYLPVKSPNSWKLTVELIDIDGCRRQYTLDPITLAETSSPSQALIPRLTSPADNYASHTRPTSFSWYVCAAPETIIAQSFTYEGERLYLLPGRSDDNDDYTLEVEDIGASDCSDHTTRLTLTPKNTDFIKYTDPDNPGDWHRWYVTVSSTNGLSLDSQIFRFRYLPGNQGHYYWCTNTQQCTAGTLTQCLASGKNCYYGSESDCTAHAALDCSATPPVQTYYWCTGQQQCTSGSLATCGATGKDCFLYEQTDDGNGCLDHAQYECQSPAQYYWCANSAGCGQGNFAACLDSGKPCYRQDSATIDCSEDVREVCGYARGVAADNPFSDLPQPVVVDEPVLTGIPVVMLWLFLPLGIIVLIWPRPRGRVYDQETKVGIPGALVIVEQNGQYVNAAITNKHGYYTGFKLPRGTYRLRVSSLQHIFPSTEERDDAHTLRNYYLGEEFDRASELLPAITFQIPVDLDPQVELTQEEQDEREDDRTLDKLWQALNTILNFVNWFWPLSFIIVLVLTFLYPIWLNLLIAAIYIVGFFRRMLASLHRANLTGRVVDADGKPVADLSLFLTQDQYSRPVGQTVTNKQGYFEAHLNPELQYGLTTHDYKFVETDDDHVRLLIDYEGQTRVNLLLVVVPYHHD